MSKSSYSLAEEALSVTQVLHAIDRFGVAFDDDSLVANAGLILPATLLARLDLVGLVNERVRLTGRVGGALPGRKIATLVTSMLAGGTHIDHATMLRAGATQAVLPFRVMAPSTLGTFLRSFTFGHVRQLDAVIDEMIRRAWTTRGLRPGDRALTVDLDSTICEVHGTQKQGAAYGYTKQLGYHPLLATRAGTGELLHARLRKGSSQRGHKHFVQELIARVRRGGATGPITLRADSGFWSWELCDTLTKLGVAWSITVTQNRNIKTAIASIPETAWTKIAYPDNGIAEVADVLYTTGNRRDRQRTVRLVVRRTRLTDTTQAMLWPDWRHHAFITSDTKRTPVEADQFHREHATVELAIKDLKEGAGLEHCPSGNFSANSAWLACGIIAHNLTRWTARLGELHPADQLTVTRTIRTRHFAIPARLVNRSGRLTLRLPTRWPWADRFTTALALLRSIRLTT